MQRVPPAGPPRPIASARALLPLPRAGREAAFANALARLGSAASGPVSPEPAPPARARVPRREHERAEERAEAPEGPGRELEPADSTWAHRAALVGPPPGDRLSEARSHVEQIARHASLSELAPTLLRKMAWSGDGRKGAARLELGAGALAGAIVTLEADHGVVALAVSGLAPAEESNLRARLAAGLEARGFRLAP